jgi:hypothetical protein
MAKRSKYFTVKILTKAYLKKYIHSLYGRTVIFSTSNQFGTIMMALLERPNIQRESKEKIKIRLDEYKCELLIFCPIWFIQKNMYGFDISENHMISLNKFIDQRFTEDLYKFCFILNKCGVSLEDAMEEFCKTHSIEIDEDITLDALKKKEYRYRKHLNDIEAGIVKNKITSIQQLLY